MYCPDLFSFFIFLGPLARDDLGSPGKLLWVSLGMPLKFSRYQTVSPDMTYLSRHAVTSLSVRMRSVT